MIALRLAGLALAAALFASPATAGPRAVAVTFDDLPYQAPDAVLCDPEQAMALTEDFVAMLRPLDTRATVFVNEGKVCDERRADLLPALLNVWLDAGLDMGNHTFSHINIHRTTVEAYLADVDAGAPVSRAALAARGRPLRFFRHPYLFTGETPEKKAAIAAGLAERGYTVAPVTIDNSDWMFAAVYRQAEAAGDEALSARIGDAYVAYMAAMLDHWEPYSAELTGGREPAQVLLLHANSLNRDWYPRIHALYLDRGYRFVTLDEALADPIYGHADDWVRANGVSWLHRWTLSEGRPVRWEPEPPAWIAEAYAAL
ncbi:MAG: polysaccharide deacetylase family protein [Phenylobacterium sp.]|uniref:polysaccharide deacetylase family protein n=1 Tax=Brevundimonas sp. TaxID=1871086 RepID=UPI002737C88B|nr:polysaccharide deacetylase family protein [Brevundimonas sp.]MDP3802111.1 polysaccharide deacetylase family protein [Brevundimonas sp.]MDZ4373459.1 polysaccharide deacetylase family protein [Phenylobacterium sp.]